MIRNIADQNYNEAQFLQYVMHVLKTSRSKRHAEARLQGLLTKRLAIVGNLTEFTPEMIEEYLLQETENKMGKQPSPPNPPLRN